MTKDKIHDFGEEKRKRENAKKRTKTEVSPSGGFLYAEEPVNITEAQALEIAQGIKEKFSDEKVLLADFIKREKHRMDATNLTFDPELEKDPAVRMKAGLESQKEFAKLSTTGELVKILDVHKKHQNHFYGIYLLAVAEELLNRL